MCNKVIMEAVLNELCTSVIFLGTEARNGPVQAYQLLSNLLLHELHYIAMDKIPKHASIDLAFGMRVLRSTK
jgi:hypothetical protein